jgi:hypothetical protein
MSGVMDFQDMKESELQIVSFLFHSTQIFEQECRMGINTFYAGNRY